MNRTFSYLFWIFLGYTTLLITVPLNALVALLSPIINKRGRHPSFIRRDVEDTDQCLHDIEKYLSKINEYAKIPKILDLGCNDGTLAQKLSHKYSIIGLDIEKEALIEAHKKGLSVIYGDATHTPLKDNIFSFIYCVDVLEHVINPEIVIIEAYRMLKNGGLFYISVPNYYGLDDTIHRFFDLLIYQDIEHISTQKFEKWLNMLQCSNFEINEYKVTGWFIYTIRNLIRLIGREINLKSIAEINLISKYDEYVTNKNPNIANYITIICYKE